MAPNESSGMKINLSMLIDFLLQKTYHELTILSELLPRKSDIERKIEIVQFANKTRQQFVRLLALVKWAASAGRVDKCQALSTFLDKQSLIFVDTADMLAKMSRETLVQARLPTFSLPAAVDVLTTGSYCRLPTCIRDKIVPPDPITLGEKNKTLKRLTQVIQHRLLTTKLPLEMSNLIIADGKVKFRVEYEFEVSLTVMGDDPLVPWRLLSIEFLVQNLATGDGKPLVHSRQKEYIHQLVQSRLFGEEEPLVDMYNCLHYFCLVLQVKVLHHQAKQLIAERWGENVRIDEYTGGKLTLSYWWWGASQQTRKQDPARVTIRTNNEATLCKLRLHHTPPLPKDLPQEQASLSSVPEQELCIERVLMSAIGAQSAVKLRGLLNALVQEKTVKSKATLDASGHGPRLIIQPWNSPVPDDIIVVSIDTKSGAYIVTLGCHKETEICKEMETSLNSNPKQFIGALKDARCSLYLRKCQRSMKQLPVLPSTHLPLVNVAKHPIAKLGKHKMFLQLRRHASFYVVVEAINNQETGEVEGRFFLLKVKAATAEDTEQQGVETKTEPQDSTKGGGVSEKKAARRSSKAASVSETTRRDSVQGRNLFAAPDHFVSLDPEIVIDFHSKAIEGLSVKQKKESNCTDKRKLKGDEEMPKKKQKLDVFSECLSNISYIGTLGHVVALCNARIPFINLCEELAHHGVAHQGVQSEAELGLAVRILHLPHPTGCEESTVTALQDNILDVVIRLTGESKQQWQIEIVLVNCPFYSNSGKEDARHLFFEYEFVDPSCTSSESGQGGVGGGTTSIVKQILDDWRCMCMLYDKAFELQEYLKDSQTHLRHICRVHSFDYKEVTIQYDADKEYMVSVRWSVKEAQFVLTFLQGGSAAMENPHRLVSTYIQNDFNKNLSLPYMVQALHETLWPLLSISKLSTTPMLGMTQRPLQPSQTFSVIPQSAARVLIVYRNIASNALEVHFRGKNLVAIRDASYSCVDPSKPKQPWHHILNLKVFLQQFEDDIAKAGGISSKHASTADDEAPPSPMESEPSAIETHFTSPQQFLSSSTGLTASPGMSRTSPQTGSSTSVPLATSHSPSLHRSSPSPGQVGNVQSPGNVYPIQSPASSFLQPSPAQGSPASSLSYVAHSPASGHQFPLTSPYNIALTSPGGWPVSPQVSGPSQAKYRQQQPSGPGTTSTKLSTTPPRPLATRPWAAAMPTLLSHSAFNKLLSPVLVAPVLPYGAPVAVSPLERFLGSINLKRHLTRVVVSDTKLEMIKSESTVQLFKGECLQCCVSLDVSTLSCLHLNVKPLSTQESIWQQDDLRCLERFFETRVACSPYRANAMTAFARILGAPANILRDSIKIMKLEMSPDMSHRWRLEWCLTIPPNAPAIAPPGTPAVVLMAKMLFFIQLSKLVPPSTRGDVTNVVIPVVYDTQNNTTMQADISAKSAGAQAPPSYGPIVSAFLKNLNESAPKTGECTIFPAVLELVKNLVLPTS